MFILRNVEQQKENINNNVCSMIIDGGGCVNVAILIRKLNLNIIKHKRPLK